MLDRRHATSCRILSNILSRYDRNLVPKVGSLQPDCAKSRLLANQSFQIRGVDVDIELLIQKVTEINELQSSSKVSERILPLMIRL